MGNSTQVEKAALENATAQDFSKHLKKRKSKVETVTDLPKKVVVKANTKVMRS
jgi:hypothetical protein